MAVLIPRVRTIGIRLSEEEYLALERFCVESGARSISEFARNAICSFVSRSNQEKALLASVNQNSTQVKELEMRLEMLAGELSKLKAGLPSQVRENGDRGRERGNRDEERSAGAAQGAGERETPQASLGLSGDRLPQDDNDSSLNAKNSGF